LTLGLQAGSQGFELYSDDSSLIKRGGGRGPTMRDNVEKAYRSHNLVIIKSKDITFRNISRDGNGQRAMIKSLHRYIEPYKKWQGKIVPTRRRRKPNPISQEGGG
jgi:hypothetical protein